MGVMSLGKFYGLYRSKRIRGKGENLSLKAIGKCKLPRLQKGKSVRIQVSYRASKNESMRNIYDDWMPD